MKPDSFNKIYILTKEQRPMQHTMHFTKGNEYL